MPQDPEIKQEQVIRQLLDLLTQLDEETVKAWIAHKFPDLPMRIEWGTKGAFEEMYNKQDQLIVIYVRRFLEDVKKEPNPMFQMGLAMRLIHDLTTEIK
jgi:uncharacterized protein YdhG (YjbR/CyaY superfamily)